MKARGLILAAPASGSGKTLVTAGLLRHLRRRGLRVAAAKAGPDFIDPTFHAAASGGACVNLDPWAMRPHTLAARVAALEAAAEIVLCEGVMGLFDGTGADGEAGSTAELAQRTGWPVVLVVDARGQGASVAALLRGFACHRPELPLAGVIFNRVASERHRALLAGAAARHLPGLAMLGALPADPALALPSRHLGLVPAGEIAAAGAVIDHAAAQIGLSFDIDRLLQLARPSLLGEADGGNAPNLPLLGQRIAIAGDDAFRFVYSAVLDGWRRAGAELSFFSPLADEPPDPGAAAVYLPGGYPELWAGRLAGAERFLYGLRAAAAEAKPVYGECGGYMVLGEALIAADGRRHPMAGLLPLVTSFAERRLSLGYRGASLLASGPLGAAGARFRGHEFHYATVVHEGAADRLWSAADAAGADLGRHGLRQGSVIGSFIHLIDRSDQAPNDSTRAPSRP
ncbi:MAG: cobyrinate a,c-diamide synthase [Stellaceae bacterium]